MTTNASRPELKFNRYDAVVAAIVALLAVAVALWFYLPKTQSGELTVVISTGGEETERVKLNSFTETTVTHNGYTLRITADGQRRAGGGQRLSHPGLRTHRNHHPRGQSIVCLPAQVVVHLEGAASADAPDVIVG